MQINVETISDQCYKCRRFEIIDITYYADDEVHEREYRCVHLYDCKGAIELYKEGAKDESNTCD